MARIRAVADGDRRLYLEFRNGNTGSVDSESAFDLSVGDVVLVVVEDESTRLVPVPNEIWPDEPWVGVVRLRLPDVTVLESGGRLRRIPTADDVAYREGNTVEAGDFSGVLRVLHEEPIRYVDLPAVDDTVIDGFRLPSGSSGLTFDDFGGLRTVIDRARELIELPLQHHDALAAVGARPIKGVLFTGPPGTGKTMLARIIASEAGAAFFKISGPEIFSKWYGQSEEILRKLFEAAAAHDRAILFFDEIDSVASRRDDDTHEASRRVVAQLLTLMDGFDEKRNVVVIAATNRPDDIDPALRRPGRFDWEIDFPLPDRHDRESILVTSGRPLKTLDPLPHALIAERTESWSAADLTAIWSEAALLAVADGRSSIMVEDYVGGFERVAEQRRRIGIASIYRSNQ